jgi:hypothetical protein
MKRSAIAALVVVLVLSAVLFSSGCRRVKLSEVPGARGPSSESTAVPIGAAKRLVTTVRIGAGSLRLHAAETSVPLALEATFRNVPDGWDPQVHYSLEATKGVLGVLQADMSGGRIRDWAVGIPDNEWDLGLAPGVPCDLTLESGVGESILDLRDIDVRKLDVVAGVGKTTVDLSGLRASGVTGRVEGGVGDLELILPKGVGARLTGGDDGIGKREIPGFRRAGDAWVNAEWDSADPKIELRLVHGVGEVTVRTAELAPAVRPAP